MQPDLYRENILRMLRAVNTLDSTLTQEKDWSHDHEALADTLNILRESLQEFRGLLTDLDDDPTSFAGEFEARLKELDMHMQSANTSLNLLRAQAFDLQIGLDPRLTSHLGLALGELAEQMQRDYREILLDERDMNPDLFRLQDTGIESLGPLESGPSL